MEFRIHQDFEFMLGHASETQIPTFGDCCCVFFSTDHQNKGELMKIEGPRDRSYCVQKWFHHPFLLVPNFHNLSILPHMLALDMMQLIASPHHPKFFKHLYEKHWFNLAYNIYSGRFLMIINSAMMMFGHDLYCSCGKPKIKGPSGDGFWHWVFSSVK